jgi:hypothetical protein
LRPRRRGGRDRRLASWGWRRARRPGPDSRCRGRADASAAAGSGSRCRRAGRGRWRWWRRGSRPPIATDGAAGPIELWWVGEPGGEGDPMSAMPSTVPSSGRSWIWTPRARSWATSAATSSTCQEASVASSTVPVVLWVTTSQLPAASEGEDSSFSSNTLKAERAGVEPARTPLLNWRSSGARARCIGSAEAEDRGQVAEHGHGSG